MSLTNKIVSGNREAFDKVFEKYYLRLVSFVNSYINNIGDAEDIAQNSFVIFWEKRGDLKADSQIAPLLFKIAKNATLDFLRHKSVVSRHSSGVRDEILFINSQLNSIALDELDENRFNYYRVKSQIKTILMSLPIGDRRIFILSRFNNLTNSEIAKLLNLSPKTIEKRLSLTIKVFKKHFKIMIIFLR